MLPAREPGIQTQLPAPLSLPRSLRQPPMPLPTSNCACCSYYLPSRPGDVLFVFRPGSDEGRLGSCCPPCHAGYVLIQQRLEEKVAAAEGNKFAQLSLPNRVNGAETALVRTRRIRLIGTTNPPQVLASPKCSLPIMLHPGAWSLRPLKPGPELRSRSLQGCSSASQQPRRLPWEDSGKN
jgi:hypothetical protein